MSTKKKRETDKFANYAISVRKKLKLTKTQTAKALDLSRQAIVVWELARKIPLNRREQIIALLHQKAREYNAYADQLQILSQPDGGTNEA